MCGIVGRQQRDPLPLDTLERLARTMNRCLRHRGPDSEGYWTDPLGRCALGFSRLAIQDLSPAANQPMRSEGGRYVLVYNGEVYNAEELRDWLGRPPSSFRTHGDTEVLLACFERFGIEQTLPRVNGMFAVGLWDNETGVLALARDRVGKKPLYYTTDADCMSFASELKAILSVDASSRQLCAEALEAYFSLIYIPAPLAIFEGVHKLRPGHIVRVRNGAVVSDQPYWTLEAILENRSRKNRTYPELVSEAEALLEDAVRRRLISDVPVGLLLSGGIDSSLVACMLSRLGADVQSFTIGVPDRELDEAAEAHAIAKKLGIRHTVLALTHADTLHLANSAIDFLDEPFGDPSAVPTFAVCYLARQSTTVLLSGDGGDEVFGGYLRHQWGVRPRHWVAHLYGRYRARSLSLSCREVALEMYRRLMSSGVNGEHMLAKRLDHFAGRLDRLPAMSLLDYMRYLDFRLYLPDDILFKIDRMSMANSVELRSPFLDHRLVDFSWTLPDSALLEVNVRKRITRDLFARHIGSAFLQHKKHGFALPVANWLRGPLREQTETALTELAGRDDLPLSGESLLQLRGRLNAGQHLDGNCAWKIWLAFTFWRWSCAWERAGGGERFEPTRNIPNRIDDISQLPFVH
jgi:asparagine synthase (glutamine-hydrolysing)